MTDQQKPYEQPAYGTPVVMYAPVMMRPPGNGLATASLVTGIIGAFFGLSVPIPVLGIISAVIALPLGIVAVALGFPALPRARRMGTGRGAAIAGIVLGFFALGITIIVTVGWIVLVATGAATTTPTPTPTPL